MVSSLDDQMLDELMQVVQMEKETRQSQQAAPQDGSQDQSQQAPPPGPDMSQMAQKSELEDTKNRLAKAEKQAADLQQSFTSMTDLLDKMVNRPVQKAVTDVRQIDYIDKGEKALSKSEAENISDADLKKRLTEMSKDQKQLGALTKRERETLGDFFINKQRTPEILKLVSNK
jgi:cell shape-determining protein MreC